MLINTEITTPMKLVNKQLGQRDTIVDLINGCIGTTGFCYTYSLDGFGISIKAGEAIHKNIKRFSQSRHIPEAD